METARCCVYPWEDILLSLGLLCAMGPFARPSVGKEAKLPPCLVWRLLSQLSVYRLAPPIPTQAQQGVVTASLQTGDAIHLPPSRFAFLSSFLRLADTMNLVTEGSLCPVFLETQLVAIAIVFDENTAIVYMLPMETQMKTYRLLY